MITAKNIRYYLNKPHYIDIPRKKIMLTFLFHAAIIGGALLFAYNVFLYVAVPVLVWEYIYIGVFLRKIWRMVGYSPITFIMLWLVYSAVILFASFLLRPYILTLIQYLFFRR